MEEIELQNLAAGLAAYRLPVQPGAAGRRPLVADRAGDRVPALLRQIAETILPRRLVFRADARLLLEVTVAHRQLLRILDADTELAADGSLMDSPLSELPQTSLHRIATLLTAVCRRSGPITVQSYRLPGPHDPAERGMPADLIARHVNPPKRHAPDSDESIARFLSGAKIVPTACLRMEAGDIAAAEGDDGALSDLLDLSRLIWGDPEADGTVRDQPGQAQFIILATAPDTASGPCTLLIRAGQARWLMQYDDADAVALAENWLARNREAQMVTI